MSRHIKIIKNLFSEDAKTSDLKHVESSTAKGRKALGEAAGVQNDFIPTQQNAMKVMDKTTPQYSSMLKDYTEELESSGAAYIKEYKDGIVPADGLRNKNKKSNQSEEVSAITEAPEDISIQDAIPAVEDESKEVSSEPEQVDPQSAQTQILSPEDSQTVNPE